MRALRLWRPLTLYRRGIRNRREDQPALPLVHFLCASAARIPTFHFCLSFYFCPSEHLLLYACFGPLSGADKTLRFAPDAGQITVAQLAKRFFGQLAISAQGRQQCSLI